MRADLLLHTGLEEEKKDKPVVGIKKGDIYYADLSPVTGSEQGGLRPVLIVQNDIGNKYSPTTIVAAVTSKMDKAKLPTHVNIPYSEDGLSRNSVVMLEQVRTIDKSRLRERVCSIDEKIVPKVSKALAISMGIEV